MIQIGDTSYAFSDPIVIAVLIGAGAVLLVFILLIMSVRRAGESARMVAPIAQQMGMLGQQVRLLSDGQQQLSGGLNHVSEAQAASQVKMLHLMEQRLADVSKAMGEN
ncbi:MAG: DNA recombination protein RmuC, partial [Paracoccaceae bacterium]